MIPKDTRRLIQLEIKFKNDIEFLKTLGPYKIYACYSNREIEFYRVLTLEEVKKVLEIIPEATMGGSYAKDFSYSARNEFNGAEKDMTIKSWIDMNASASANCGIDGNHFSGWNSN